MVPTCGAHLEVCVRERGGEGSGLARWVVGPAGDGPSGGKERERETVVVGWGNERDYESRMDGVGGIGR